MEPRFSDIFIVTYGRAGSALRALQASRAHVAAAGLDKVSHPFYGASRGRRFDSEREIIELARRFLRHGSPAATVCGFNDVRYDVPDLEDYLDFLAAISARPQSRLRHHHQLCRHRGCGTAAGTAL